MTTETQGAAPHHDRPEWLWYVGTVAAGIVWVLLYRQLIAFSEWATGLFPVARDSHSGEAIAFFYL